MELASSTLQIVRNPAICGGDPTIAGTRIAVHDVVRHAHVYGGDLQRVSEEALPYLSIAQIRAVMAWYDAHREEIDAILELERAAYERIRSQSRPAKPR